ncbi:MAG: hypothetical protein FJ319_02330 [SAR202 cluster bacterium]|nr:hypothetical protein [SAR202 cluster bacterium]
MAVIEKLASSRGRRDEEPNIALAKEIAFRGNRAAVEELTQALHGKDKAVKSDAIKVLYELGALKPTLIADHVEDFVKLLGSTDNRLVWGAMTALGSIADIRADKIWQNIEPVIKATQTGSVITQDWGVRVLATVAAKHERYRSRLFPFLMLFLQACEPKDFPRHLESIVPAINADGMKAVLELVEQRRVVLNATQAKRVDRVVKSLGTAG